MSKNVSITLSTGHSFRGSLIGYPIIASGEVVFTTGMTGYSEAISDPSYMGQILVFSYPLIGNYGIPKKNTVDNIPVDGIESNKIFLSGVILQEVFESPIHRTSSNNLFDWLYENKIPGIVGLDTRQLTQIIRDNGKVLAKIIPDKPLALLSRSKINFKEDENAVNNFFDPSAYNLLPEVSSENVLVVGEGKYLVNVVDCGIKWSIVKELLARNCTVRILPWNANLEEYKKCDGWLFSNGPGDPGYASDLIKNIKQLLNDSIPVLGICLGHQLIALASGATTYRLPYGHRSQNQPVRMVGTDKAFITSQNHGYAVSENSLQKDWSVWFENLNDGSIEGIKHNTKPFYTTQFHPEANSGPNDTKFIFNDFIKSIEERFINSGAS